MNPDIWWVDDETTEELNSQAECNLQPHQVNSPFVLLRMMIRGTKGSTVIVWGVVITFTTCPLLSLSLLYRTNDGSQRWAKFKPAPPNGPHGKYQFTPNQTFALYPQLAATRPEVIRAAEDFDTFGGPPEILSSKYNSDYQTAATVGNANSPLQTPVLKDTARFWEDGASTFSETSFLPDFFGTG